MRIGLISGGFPPDTDGIGDYTWWLAKTLAESTEVKAPVYVFTRLNAQRNASPEVEVIPFFDLHEPSSFKELPNLIRSLDLDWIVLQYNPFCFGKRGFCPWVPQTLTRIHQSPKTRIAIMFHETCVPKWPWRFAIMYLWQQPIFRQLCQIADIAFVSTERWLPQVQRANPKLPCCHLPVGSNIPLCELSQVESRRTLGLPADTLVLGVFGFAHVSRRLDWIAAAAKAVALQRPETILLYLGPDGPVVRKVCEKLNLIDAGLQSASRVGIHLRAMDLLLAPFSDGISTRRGSTIAALQHGIPVATTLSAWSDGLFRRDAADVLIYPTGDHCEDFVNEVTSWLGSRNWKPIKPCNAITEFHNRHLAWEHLTDVMLEGLSSCEAAP